jgi:probable HAF family extracellular repeat protein
MRRPYVSKVLLLAAVIFCGSLAIVGAQTLHYTITNLGEFGSPFSAFSEAYAINSAGQVTGEATATNGSVHAFLYNGQMHDLGSLIPKGSSRGFGINYHGIVVGQSDVTGGSDAFYIATGTQSAMMVDMGQLPKGNQGSAALGINDSDVIVGNSYHGSGLNPNAFLYQYPGGPMQDLGDLEGTANGVYYTGALAINNHGVIVGEGQDPNATYHALIYSGTTMMGLPMLPGDAGSDAYAINSFDVAVGQTGSNDGAGSPHPVMWIGTNVTSLGGLSTNGIGTALGINDAGQIVGTSYNGSQSHAFVYTKGIMTDLNTLIEPGQSGGFLFLAQASAINNVGTIVGYGYLTSTGFPFAFVATPNIPTGGGSNPNIFMNEPVLRNKQVLLNFTVTSLTNATYHLLQAARLNSAWITNTLAVFTTNVLNGSYRFTDTNNAALRFYRVQSP